MGNQQTKKEKSKLAAEGSSIVGGSGTAGLAEVYAMRKVYKENMKKKLKAARAAEAAAAEAAAAEASSIEDKDNIVEMIKNGEMKKKPKKTLLTNSRVSSVDI